MTLDGLPNFINYFWVNVEDIVLSEAFQDYFSGCFILMLSNLLLWEFVNFL